MLLFIDRFIVFALVGTFSKKAKWCNLVVPPASTTLFRDLQLHETSQTDVSAYRLSLIRILK